mmetsp:Transcript_19707/g.9153  ORF Transcript_19707/g.9153 Transcript_19707/m.9153 type:complete len:88 (+) Transcript_19707:98-361(+)
MDRRRASGLRLGLMGPSILGSSNMGREVARDRFYIRLGKCTRVNLKMTKCKVKGPSNGKMTEPIPDNGKITKCTGRGCSRGAMGTPI